MATTTKKTVKKSTEKKKAEPLKKVSKAWLAMMANKGFGEIIDMEAVLK